MKLFPLSSTEMFGLSVLNPIGAVMIGAGTNFLLASMAMPVEQADAAGMLRFAAICMLGFGAAIVATTWAFFVVVWFQSRDQG